MVSASDIQHAIQKFIQSFTFFENQTITPGKISDGILFSGILTTVNKFKFMGHLLKPKAQKWPTKLENLKTIIAKIQEFFYDELDKGVKTRDIDLVKIAKDNNVEEINKMFEVIIAILMEANNKEEYIESIMQLDQRSQNSFVEIIKNAMENRVCSKQQGRDSQMQYIIQQLQSQNISIKEELQSTYKYHQQLQKQIQSYQEKVCDIENQLDRSRVNKNQYIIEDSDILCEKYEKMLSNLKKKLIAESKDHQITVATYEEKIHQLEEKLRELETSEEMAIFYKQKYEEASQNMNKASIWERQKLKLLKMIDEKDINMSKMQEKIEELTEKCLQLEENEIYHKMQLKKQEIKFSQIQKNIKNKNIQNSSKILMISQIQKNILSKQCFEKENQNENEIDQNHNPKYQLKIKNLQRENTKLSRKLVKYKQMQLQKNRLECLLREINECKNEEMQIVSAAIYETYQESRRLWQAFRNDKVQK